MNQSIATVLSNQRIIKELIRRRDLSPSQPRDILGSWIIWLKCPEIARDSRPGQFVMVKCGEDTILPRPFSIHQVNKGAIALFYSVLDDGKGTNWLSNREKGNELQLVGPLGNGFEINPESSNLLLVAGGNGIAPLYFLAQQALEQGHRVKLCLGTSGETSPSGEKNPDQRYPLTLLPPGIQVTSITSSEDGQTGLVTELLPDCIDKAGQVFACGPFPMYRAMVRMPELRGKSVQISLEVRMACGRGLCYGCTIKTKDGLRKVCQDGPVFNLDDILWDEIVPV